MKTKHPITYLIAILLIFFSSSCNEPFNAEKWKTKGVDWYLGDFREKMVDDLIDSDTLRGMDSVAVVHLLGRPDSYKPKVFQYVIREKYGMNIDPEYIKYVLVEFDTNGKVIKYVINKQ